MERVQAGLKQECLHPWLRERLKLKECVEAKIVDVVYRSRTDLISM